MTSRTTERFRNMLAALPAEVRQQARQSYRLFSQDPQHPGLRFRQVHLNPLLYSARIGIHYRAVVARDGEALVWFWIGPHAEYDYLLTQF